MGIISLLKKATKAFLEKDEEVVQTSSVILEKIISEPETAIVEDKKVIGISGKPKTKPRKASKEEPPATMIPAPARQQPSCLSRKDSLTTAVLFSSLSSNNRPTLMMPCSHSL